MIKTDLIFPSFSSRFVDFAVQFCFRWSDARVRFDSGAIFLDQSQFFAMQSNQWNCFILKRSKITSNGFFSCKGGAKAGFRVMLNYFEIKKAFHYYIKQIDSMLPCVWFSRELKHRSFWATVVNRKSRLLLFDTYFTLFIQKVKL